MATTTPECHQYKNATIGKTQYTVIATPDRDRETATRGDLRPLDDFLPLMVNQIRGVVIHQPALLLTMVFEERQRPSRDQRNNPSEMSSNVREWDKRAQQDRDRNLDYDNYRRGRSPVTKGRNGGYRDRDRVGYRSSGHDSRSRSRSPRRDKSPYYGAPPSREVILEGLPLEMTEEDVPTPTNPFSAYSSKTIIIAA